MHEAVKPGQVAGPYLLREMEGSVRWVTFNRPPAHAFSMAMIEALQEEMDHAASDPETRAILLASTGRIFCAGHDLKEIRAHRSDPDGGRAYLEKLFGACSALMQSIARHPKPVVAAIDGLATAAGCQIAASADIVIATERAGFATPGVSIGGFCATPMVALSRRVAPGIALEMLLTGEVIDAARARECGLVNRIVAPDRLRQASSELGHLLASRSPEALARGKAIFQRHLTMPLAEAYDFANQAMIEGFLAGDAVEGIDSFLERRKPVWGGR